MINIVTQERNTYPQDILEHNAMVYLIRLLEKEFIEYPGDVDLHNNILSSVKDSLLTHDIE